MKEYTSITEGSPKVNIDYSGLSSRLSICNIQGKRGEKIIEQIINKRKQQKFESLRVIINAIEGLSDKKMVDVIDIYSKTYFD